MKHIGMGGPFPTGKSDSPGLGHLHGGRGRDITLCTVHRDTPHWLEIQLARLDLHGRPQRIIVGDNGSTKESASGMRRICERHGADFYTIPDVAKHGGALDRMMNLVQTRWVVGVDSDSYPIHDGWLDVLFGDGNFVLCGAASGCANRGNPSGNYVHPSLCLVDMEWLRDCGGVWLDNWDEWDTGEKLTILAESQNRPPRYIPETRRQVHGTGRIYADVYFHAFYGTRIQVFGARHISNLDGFDAEDAARRQEQLIRLERLFLSGGGEDPFSQA
jgi:hypothetical protein